MKTIGEKIRWLRLKHNCKQHTLARALGISPAALSKMEAGISEASISRLVLIAQYFEVSPGAVLDSDEPGTDEHTTIIQMLKEQLLAAEQNLVKLQGKLIEMYERMQ